MKPKSMTYSLTISMIVMLLTFATKLPSSSSPGTTRPWTAVGSAGTVTAVSRSCISTTNPYAIILNCPSTSLPTVLQSTWVGFKDLWTPPGLAMAPTGYDYSDHLEIQYNVVATEGLFETGDKIRMKVKFLDPGDYATVTLNLYEYNQQTGISTTRLLFNSNQYPASLSFQDQSVFTTTWTDFDFSQNVYYIEANLSMTHPILADLTAPRLAAIRLEKTPN